MKKHTIYLIGVVFFGIFYSFLKSNLHSIVFIGIALVYALSLNVLAHKIGKEEKDE